jgi:hypothetical protein
MVLDAQRVLANQIAFERLYGLLRSFEKAPCPGFAQTGDTLIGKNLDEKIPADGYGRTSVISWNLAALFG